MAQKFLDKAYALSTSDETKKLYDDWSSSYDDEVGENGYATPGRIAKALAGLTPDKNAPILDFGCGTGVSGEALRAAGFTTIDGMDISAEMLKHAAEKGIYRNLTVIPADTRPPVNDGEYPTITAIGVIGVGAAPLETFDTLMGLLGRGGRFALSFNDHALEDPAFAAKVNEYVDTGAARLLLREYGDHLPGRGIKSMIYVLEKA